MRSAAFLGLLALFLNLLVPLAVVAAAPAPAQPDAYICHATGDGDDGGAVPAGADTNAPAAHHCPLCVVLSGGLAASQDFAYAAVLPPPPGRLRPVSVAASLAPVSLRLIAPQSRAPPAVPA